MVIPFRMCHAFDRPNRLRKKCTRRKVIPADPRRMYHTQIDVCNIRDICESVRWVVSGYMHPVAPVPDLGRRVNRHPRDFVRPYAYTHYTWYI